MERRILGKTGLEVSILGQGGFHLLEVTPAEAQRLLHHYLDAGGNYIETAAEYGDGDSERKIGPVMAERRQDCILASKCHAREESSAGQFIVRSLENLQTDHLDILFMHHVQRVEELQRLLAPDGALRAAKKAKEQGKVRFIGISNHGHPQVLIQALQEYPFDVVMTNFNYYDQLNFPALEDELLPLTQAKNVGVVGMKAIADGFLWRSAALAFRYAWSLPIHVMAAGMNTLDMLKKDLDFAEHFHPLSEDEKTQLLQEAPELGNYVCRQCGGCLPCPENIDIPGMFKLEGWYDRQMWDGVVRNTENYLMRQLLGKWFRNDERARAAYKALTINANACTACGQCGPCCPYQIDIVEKLKLAHYKLTEAPKIL